MDFIMMSGNVLSGKKDRHVSRPIPSGSWMRHVCFWPLLLISNVSNIFRRRALPLCDDFSELMRV